MAESVAGSTLRFVSVDIVADFVFFPVWWYTAGFVRALRRAGVWLAYARQVMAVGLWAKNLFTPMFAQRDITGRLISFFVRLAMIAARSVGLGILVALIALFLVAWFLSPLALAALVVLQVAGLFGA